jgi:hypothetical protein
VFVDCSDEESEEESPSAKKRVPAWASSPALRAQLANQTMETDEFFPPQHAKTCDLDEVPCFSHFSQFFIFLYMLFFILLYLFFIFFCLIDKPNLLFVV